MYVVKEETLRREAHGLNQESLEEYTFDSLEEATVLYDSLDLYDEYVAEYIGGRYSQESREKHILTKELLEDDDIQDRSIKYEEFDYDDYLVEKLKRRVDLADALASDKDDYAYAGIYYYSAGCGNPDTIVRMSWEDWQTFPFSDKLIGHVQQLEVETVNKYIKGKKYACAKETNPFYKRGVVLWEPYEHLENIYENYYPEPDIASIEYLTIRYPLADNILEKLRIDRGY